jgi:hypothetical protein
LKEKAKKMFLWISLSNVDAKKPHTVKFANVVALPNWPERLFYEFQ